MAELYELLGLDKRAAPQEIRTAITEQRRTWRRRTTSAQIEIRQEAERRMQQLDEAERTLLDDQQRREYDSYLDFALSAGSPETQEPEDIDDRHVVRALEQLGREQYAAAMFTAQRAVEEDADNSYAWSILAEASAKAGDLPAATKAIERALRLDSEDAQLHLQRGAILEESGDQERALNAYRTAVRLDPNRTEFRAQVIEYLARHGDSDEAIAEAAKAYQDHPDDGAIRDALARALSNRAELAQHELPDGTLVITDRQQASFVEALCNRGLSIQAPSEELNEELRQQREYARKQTKRTLSAVAFRRNYRWPIGMGMLLVASFCCVSKTDNSGDPSSAMLGMFMVLGFAAGFVASIVWGCTQPRYVKNAIRLEQTVARRPALGPNKDQQLNTGQKLKGHSSSSFPWMR